MGVFALPMNTVQGDICSLYAKILYKNVNLSGSYKYQGTYRIVGCGQARTRVPLYEQHNQRMVGGVFFYTGSACGGTDMMLAGN